MFQLNHTEQVQKALARNEAVLALESTIISHGMPYPQNVEMALELETIARENGATPATIAIIEGEICIGLSREQIEFLAQNPNARKLSRADIADCIAKKQTGATTVAATMILAQKAGIQTFATGGIGGVHRGAETSFDISADLEELAQTNICVICAGAKAILDLPKTYERLESLGVPVYSYQSDEIPAFYSRQSGIAAPMRADDPAEIAQSFRLQCALGLHAAILINNPIPAEYEIPAAEISPIIECALKAAKEQNIQAKAVTPFLLQKLYETSQGRSLKANIALVKNNVRLGAQIALELSANPDK